MSGLLFANHRFWHSTPMDWQRLGRWATVATITLYAAAAASLAIMLGESLLPEGSPAQRTFHDIADYLNRLGDIGSGAIIAIIVFILAGGGAGMLLFDAYDRFQEIRKRRAEERAAALAEGQAQGRAEGRAQGRAEARAEIQDRLKEQGINLDDLLPPDEPEPDNQGWLFP